MLILGNGNSSALQRHVPSPRVPRWWRPLRERWWSGEEEHHASALEAQCAHLAPTAEVINPSVYSCIVKIQHDVSASTETVIAASVPHEQHRTWDLSGLTFSLAIGETHWNEQVELPSICSANALINQDAEHSIFVTPWIAIVMQDEEQREIFKSMARLPLISGRPVFLCRLLPDGRF